MTTPRKTIPGRCWQRPSKESAMTEEYLRGLLRTVNEEERFLAHNGIRFTQVNEGCVTAELDVQPVVINRWGVPHGGALFTMGDVACGVAALSVRGESRVTRNATNVDMDRACLDGKVTAVAKVERLGGKVCFCSAEMFDCRGKRIAAMKASMYYTGTKLDFA